MWEKVLRRAGFTVGAEGRPLVYDDAWHLRLADHRRRGWTAADRLLKYTFVDSAGMEHARADAWAHWVSRIVRGFGDDVVSEDFGVRLTHVDDPDVVLVPWDGRYWVGQESGGGRHLVGDGHGLDGDALDAATRKRFLAAVRTRRCLCGACRP
ncbi:hypothetical protein [Sorangium sp. So ce117]|uniref:hypothetical protein n=1 Tax=Sorangium sp. So ce117 TaxID=3133277 RepID=UPI003F5ED067